MIELQKQKDITNINIAINTSKNSIAKRKQVGCIIVNKNDEVISYGYNYNIFSKKLSCEDENGETLIDVVHAESSAITNLISFAGQSIDFSPIGGTVYCTFSPCVNCSKLLIQIGIKRLVYLTTHSDQTGLKMMEKAGIIVEKFISE